jgi:hypothetical protein
MWSEARRNAKNGKKKVPAHRRANRRRIKIQSSLPALHRALSLCSVLCCPAHEMPKAKKERGHRKAKKQAHQKQCLAAGAAIEAARNLKNLHRRGGTGTESWKKTTLVTRATRARDIASSVVPSAPQSDAGHAGHHSRSTPKPGTQRNQGSAAGAQQARVATGAFRKQRASDSPC